MTSQTDLRSAHEGAPTAPPVGAGAVEELLRLLGRAVRAHQLYLHNNPTYLRALENLRNACAHVWTHIDELVVEVTDTQLKWNGHVVVNEPDKTGDALPWVLHKDGLRELTIRPGVEESELVALVQIIAQVRKASPDEDDLLTLLWEQEFAHLQYRYVDAGIETAAAIEPEDPDREMPIVDPAALRAPPTEVIAPPGVVSMEDFDSTLYFLDDTEVEYLREAIRRHYQADLRSDVVAILLDIFEQQTDATIREEICGLLDVLLVQLLATGQLRTVATLLREVTVAAGRARELSAAHREMLLALPGRMSEPAAVAQLLQSVEDSVDLPPTADLQALFEQLRASALGTIFDWLRRVSTAEVRRLLEGAAERLAAANTAELVRLISSPDREVARQAVRRAGALKASAAVSALARVSGQGDAGVRLAAVQALGEIGSAGALQQLERSLEDADRDVRVAAAKALGGRAHRAALPRLEAIVSGRRLQDADLTEKMAFFEAYGAVCGEPGIPRLDGILNGRGFLGKREDAELRACAAMALGRIGSAAALAALQRSAADKEVLVRNAVSKALRGVPA